jgi:hypothetical protein
MRYKITIRYESDYLHVQHTGDDSYQIALELWRRIAKACEKHQCFNILSESDTNKLLSTMDAFNHIKIFQDAGITHKHRIACCPQNFENWYALLGRVSRRMYAYVCISLI